MDYASLDAFYKSIRKTNQDDKAPNIDQSIGKIDIDEKSPLEQMERQGKSTEKPHSKLECVFIEKIQKTEESKKRNAKRGCMAQTKPKSKARKTRASQGKSNFDLLL
jgi:hypothetical protein